MVSDLRTKVPARACAGAQCLESMAARTMFERSLAVPRGIREEDIKATYTDGVLEVRIPVP